MQIICDWSTEQYLTLNPQKCKSMTISRKTKPSTAPFTLRLHNEQLEEVDQFKYLGVILNHNFSWSPHISAICTKAKKILGLLYRRFYNHSSNECIKQLYLSLVRPHLDYAAQVWDPHLQKDVQLLENVQKFALKLASRGVARGGHRGHLPPLFPGQEFMNLFYAYDNYQWCL